MTIELVSHVKQIYEAAVAAVDPRKVVNENLQVSKSELHIAGVAVPTPESGIYLIAVGKAAPAMAEAAEDILGDRLTAGIGVTKSILPGIELRTRMLIGSHPVPDERSLEAGREIVAFAESIPDGSLVLCLISGGGSALMEALQPGISLDDLQSITSQLLRGGATINELNAVRSRLSAVKAGGLLGKLAGKRVFNLIISDVLGDDPSVIASGPTVPRQASLDPDEVLERYGIQFDLPEADPQVEVDVDTAIVGNLRGALEAASDEAGRLGYRPVILSASLQGEAREVAGVIGAIVADSARGLTAFRPGDCLLAGGETTVTVAGDGTGGRNTESALAAALRLEGVPNVAAGFLATDGDDAETDAAGGIVTGATIHDANRANARDALVRNDSYTFLSAEGASWGHGPTGTNVNDLVICLLGSNPGDWADREAEGD